MCRTLPASRAARRVSPPPHRPRVSRRVRRVRPDTDLLKLDSSARGSSRCIRRPSRDSLGGTRKGTDRGRLQRERRKRRPSTGSRSPRSRLSPPSAARTAVPLQERPRRRVRLHETIERRRREAIALAAGQIARRHERRCFGCGNAHDQEHHGDHAQPAHWRFRLRGGANAHHSPPRSWPSSDQRLNVCLHAWLPTAATRQEPKQPPIRPGGGFAMHRTHKDRGHLLKRPLGQCA